MNWNIALTTTTKTNNRVCAHCGERIEQPLVCSACQADLSDLAYHSGEAYALHDHIVGHYEDDAHWQLLKELA